jgi:hypothetical protein
MGRTNVQAARSSFGYTEKEGAIPFMTGQAANPREKTRLKMEAGRKK